MAKKNSNDDGLTANYEGPVVPEGEGDELAGRQVDAAEVPEGSVIEVEQWVSGDRARAEAALDVEEAKGDDARSTLVQALKRVVEG